MKLLKRNKMEKETLEEAAENNKKIEDYYLGKTLKLKREFQVDIMKLHYKNQKLLKLINF